MKYLTRLLTFVVIFGLVLISLPLARASAATLCVDPGNPACYATIGEAVAAASAGDTITVAAGTYNEHVAIDKSLILVGTDAVIDGSGTGIVVLITAANVNFSGFTVRGSGADPQANAGVGVMVTSGAHIFNNTFTSNAVGVALAGAFDNSVEANQFSGNIIGVALTYYEAGGITFYATGNVVDGNTIAASMHSGIYGDQDCDGNTLTNNIISDGVASADGIYLWKSAGNIITGNNITDNPQYGLQLMGSSNVDISGNTITGNLDGIHIRASGWPVGAHPFYPFNIGLNTIGENTRYQIAIEVPLTLSNDPVPTAFQDVLDLAPEGATILVPGSITPYTLTGGFSIDNEHLTIVLGDGVVIENESPCFSVNASYTSILAEPGVKCIPTGGASGIVVAADLVNIVVDGLEIDGTDQSTADGIAFAGAATDIVLVDNWIHGLDGDGISFAAALAGVQDIHGNLFQDNDGLGINSSGSAVAAGFNSWGSYAGASAGDGISAGVEAGDYTHVDLYLVSSGTPWTNQVENGEQITYEVKAHMVNVNAADFVLTYNQSLLSVDSITPGADFDGLYTGDPAVEHDLVDATITGQLHFRGFKLGGTVTGDVTLFTVTFDTLTTGTGTLDFDETTDLFGMPGVGSTENVYAAALTDGSVKVITLPTISSDDIQGYYLTGQEQVFSVTIDNPATGGSFDGVLVDLKVTGADLADITSLYYWETALDPDDWALWTLMEDGSGNLVGTFGPPLVGFPMPAPYNVTTPFKVTMANAGTYPVELALRDVATGEILATYNNNAVVYEKPVITSDDLDDPYLVDVAEDVTLTITNPSSIPAPFNLVFELPDGTVIVYDSVTYTCTSAGCPPIPVALPLASNELPFTITFSAPFSGDITVTLFDSDWSPSPRELAELTVTTGAYEHYTVTGSFSIQFATDPLLFFNAYYTGIPVTLTRVGDSPSISYTATTTAPGGVNIQFDNVIAGTYEITTTMPRVLNIYSGEDLMTGIVMQKTIEIMDNTLILPLVLIRGNAVWTDNIIDIYDAVQVGILYGQTGNLNGDVNFDGKVNIQDLTIVGGNFDLIAGDVYASWTP